MEVSGSVGYLDPDTEAKLVVDDGREVTEVGMPEELYVRPADVYGGIGGMKRRRRRHWVGSVG